MCRYIYAEQQAFHFQLAIKCGKITNLKCPSQCVVAWNYLLVQTGVD